MRPTLHRLSPIACIATRLARQHLAGAMAIWLFALLATTTTLSPLEAGPPPVPPGYSSEIIYVKFRNDTSVDTRRLLAVPHLGNAVLSMTRLFALPSHKLDTLRAMGRGPAGKGLPDLNLWFKITLQPGADAAAFMDSLKQLANVEIVEAAPLPAPPPVATPDLTANQGYLDAAPGGIDARSSWTIPGGNGTGVRIYDVEYSWNQTHEDLTKASGVELLLDAGDSAVDPFADNNHGTAVLGEMVADNDTKGVTGIAWGADIGLAPANTANLGYDPANAILRAVADGAAGDVILIEQQLPVCGLPDFGPSEGSSPVFDAIQTAVANGFVVVEAAGNGSVNLDQTACGTTFNRNVRDSGAIIVGAGRPPSSGADRQRESFSTYGCRVNVQGWGSDVMTTGYGSSYTNPDDPTNPAFWYTASFSGTSSASPIVAGAVANLQGVALNQLGTPLTSAQIRTLLVESGSLQLGDAAQHIGPRPNLSKAISHLPLIAAPGAAIDLYILVDLSGSFADDLPVFKAQAPSIIATLKASNPNIRFGLGKFEDYPIAPFGSAAAGDKAYERLVDLTFDTDLVLAAIAGLFTRFGDDAPQSQLPALFQAATGAGQDLSGLGFAGASIPPCQQANFREGATKLILLWTDAAFHQPGDPGAVPYPGPTFAETVAAILALDPPMVIGISSGGGGIPDLQSIAAATGALAPPSGVDCDGDGIIDILEGEPLVCGISSSGAGVGKAIIALVTSVTSRKLTSLAPATLFIGLKNSDDIGTKVDLRVEVSVNGAFVAAGETRCIANVTRNPDKAKEVVVAFDPFSPVNIAQGDVLSFKALTRIGTNPDSTRCAGPGGSHTSALGLRLYYDATKGKSRLGAEITPDPPKEIFLHSDGSRCLGKPSPTTLFLDDTSPSGNQPKCQDSAGLNFHNGNPWQTIATWNMPL